MCRMIWTCHFVHTRRHVFAWCGLFEVCSIYAIIRSQKLTNRWKQICFLLVGPRKAKMCLRACIKCTDLDSSHACAKYHLGTCSQFMHSIVSNDSGSGQQRPWSAYADAQADLGLCCPHMPEDMFSHCAARLISSCFVIVCFIFQSLFCASLDCFNSLEKENKDKRHFETLGSRTMVPWYRGP